ncbi:unnamed protein product [Durusdinium trenchii]|uniref:Uncharacterized protein n=1 Tax=Durusdinium trenchii TaxID=1381693 RepID=A0ABP0NFA5_9DINO
MEPPEFPKSLAKVLKFNEELSKSVDVQSRVHGCKALILWPGKVGDINARSIKANFLIFKVMGRYVNASKGELLRVPVLEWCFKCLRKYWKEWLLDLMFAYLPQREAGQDDANDTDVEAMHDDGDDQEGECEDEHEIESGAEEDASPTDIPDGEKPEPATPVANGVPSGVDADGSCGPGPTEDVGPTLPPDYELPEWAQAPQSVSETDFAESGLQTLLLPHEQPELLEALHVEPHHLTANESSSPGKDSLDILRTNENFKHHILDNLAERLKAGVQPSGDECVEEVASGSAELMREVNMLKTKLMSKKVQKFNPDVMDTLPMDTQVINDACQTIDLFALDVLSFVMEIPDSQEAGPFEDLDKDASMVRVNASEINNGQDKDVSDVSMQLSEMDSQRGRGKGRGRGRRVIDDMEEDLPRVDGGEEGVMEDEEVVVVALLLLLWNENLDTSRVYDFAEFFAGEGRLTALRESAIPLARTWTDDHGKKRFQGDKTSSFNQNTIHVKQSLLIGQMILVEIAFWLIYLVMVLILGVYLTIVSVKKEEVDDDFGDYSPETRMILHALPDTPESLELKREYLQKKNRYSSGSCGGSVLGHGLAGVASPVPENKNNGEAGSVLGHGLPAATVAPPVPENQNNGEADPDAETVPAPHAPVVAALGSTMTPEIQPMVAKMWEPVQKEIDEKKRQAELELESTCQKRQKVEHEVGVWTAKLEQIQTKFALFERDLAKAQAQLQESSKMQTVLAEREHAIQAAEHELEKRQAKFEGEMDAWDSQRAVVLAEIDTKFDELRREEVQARQTQNAGPFADPKASLRAKIHQVDQVRPLLNSGSADAWGALYRVVRKVDVDGNPVKDIYDPTVTKYLVQVRDDVEQGDEKLQELQAEMQELGLWSTDFTLGDLLGEEEEDDKGVPEAKPKQKLPEYPEVEGEESLPEYLGQYKKACLSRKALLKNSKERLSEPGAAAGFETDLKNLENSGGNFSAKRQA